ncbi:DnaD/phage-associated family protein [Sedimentibacter acidaminivorans]|uniref:DnaD/phage-associated family protein n=1 Tax=Sedimentibacter acidaminivorans TaxID=913099 RepID=A0ABS4GFE5_9FIRM|nr:DnaD domain protein [Sedimentibacter acidaminivorans]MBP1926372.1 DnaD/phage-associated family protein [Sedimentibacter acidaminivorans]
MNFILQEQKIDLGDTPIENIFITDYMPIADGTYVKVYLLGYKYAKDKQGNFNNETIARNLKIPLSDVLNAWIYWENEGIIVRRDIEDEYNYIVEFVNLKQLYIDNVYKHISNSPVEKDDYIDNDELINSNRNADNKKMMEEIEEMFGRPVKINEKQKIVSWMNNYKMKPEIMTQAFSYCINNKKIKKFSYIESVVSSWYDEGVCDVESMVEYLEKRNDRFSVYSRISKSLGFNNRILTEAEMKTIDKWIDEMNFSMEMILKCLENSTKISNPNINYFDSILNKWHKKGYKTIEDLKNDKKETKSDENKKIKQIPKTNKFHNFEQKIKNYSEQELEQIVKKRLNKKLDKFGLSTSGEEEGVKVEKANN